MITKSFVMFSVISICAAEAFASHPWKPLYGDRIAFDVYRDGDLVGYYETKFSGDQNSWRATARMELEIPWLLWRFQYAYHAEERWTEQRLQSLDVRIEGNGKARNFSLVREGQWLHNEAGQVARLPILPTHHYNAAVVEHSWVFNTLTGKVNRVTVEPVLTERVEVSGGSVLATRYRYQGELNNTLAWYDDDGRWVRLQFTDQRGAEVVFKCRQCGWGAQL